MTLDQKLKEIRKRFGLSQESLAELCMFQDKQLLNGRQMKDFQM